MFREHSNVPNDVPGELCFQMFPDVPGTFLGVNEASMGYIEFQNVPSLKITFREHSRVKLRVDFMFP